MKAIGAAIKFFFKTFMLVIIVVTAVWFFIDWKHVMAIQHQANNDFIDEKTVQYQFNRCRKVGLIPMVKPDSSWGALSGKVNMTYCMRKNEYNEIILYNGEDGKPYVKGRDEIVDIIKANEEWAGDNQQFYLVDEVINSEEIKEYYREYDQRSIDEQKIRDGKLEASYGY